MIKRLYTSYLNGLRQNARVQYASFGIAVVIVIMIIFSITAPPPPALTPVTMEFPDDALTQEEIADFNDRVYYRQARTAIENDLRDILDMLTQWRRSEEGQWPDVTPILADKPDGDAGFIVTAVVFEALSHFSGGRTSPFIRDPYPLLSADIVAGRELGPRRTLPEPRPLGQILEEGYRSEWAHDYAMDWSAPLTSLSTRPFLAARRPLQEAIIVITHGGQNLRLPVSDRVDSDGFIDLNPSVSRLDVGSPIPHRAQVSSARGGSVYDIFQFSPSRVFRPGVDFTRPGKGDVMRAWIR